jgi:hypothetical protein
VVKVGSIGKSYERRPIHYILVDARVYLVTKHYAKEKHHVYLESLVNKEMDQHFHTQPAVVITG